MVAFANGSVKLFNSETGSIMAEIGAHSRQISGMVCHPTKCVFVTCGDDTFLNIWKVVSSSKKGEIEIEVVSSSRVPDFMLTGVCFGKADLSSVICSVYDYKQLLVWDNIL